MSGVYDLVDIIVQGIATVELFRVDVAGLYRPIGIIIARVYDLVDIIVQGIAAVELFRVDVTEDESRREVIIPLPVAGLYRPFGIIIAGVYDLVDIIIQGIAAVELFRVDVAGLYRLFGINIAGFYDLDDKIVHDIAGGEPARGVVQKVAGLRLPFVVKLASARGRDARGYCGFHGFVIEEQIIRRAL
jgi:hypothetical protein